MHLITTGTPRRFAQIWPSDATGEWVVREGSLGRAGRVRETGVHPASTPIDELAAPFLAAGFVEVAERDYGWVVAQFPTRNSAADRRLIEHAGEWIAGTLDERGLGFLDGHDRGKRGGDGKLVVNLFACVIDLDLGAQAVMSALRAGRADATRATIAHRRDDDDVWTVRYERTAAKLPGPFAL